MFLNVYLALNSKAEGLKGISPKFLKLLLPLVLSHITHIMNTAITISTFPSAWKYAKIVPVPKSQTEFRPISLLPFLSKIFVNILAALVQPFMDINSMLSEKQSGFRKNKCCIRAITDVVWDIRARLDTNYMSLTHFQLICNWTTSQVNQILSIG